MLSVFLSPVEALDNSPCNILVDFNLLLCRPTKIACKNSALVSGWRNGFVISVFIATLLFCEVNSYLFFCLKTGELQ